MTQTQTISRRINLGDAAVEGLLAGIGAGIGMAVSLLLTQLLQGHLPQEALGSFDVSGSGSPVVGAVMHLAVSGVYGVVFGLVWSRIPALKRWGTVLAGMVYGLVLFFIAEAIILPRSASPLASSPLWELGLAHLVYGALLGAILARARR